MNRIAVRRALLALFVIAALLAAIDQGSRHRLTFANGEFGQRGAATSSRSSSSPAPAGVATLAAITVDDPAAGAIFPPDFAPPRFIWRDAAADAKVWRIEITFSDGSSSVKAITPGERLRVGEIDPRCVADTNKPPELTAEQAKAWSWKPDAPTWAAIKKHSIGSRATITITGFAGEHAAEPISRGQTTIETSPDPVGALIFYRDVPLIPSVGEKGVIKPLPENIIPFIKWRLRSVSDTESRTLMEGLPTCANCHSFSRDGKTLGMDVDGPQNDKGLYSLTPIKAETSIRKENVIQWSSFRPVEASDNIRVGFMSQVSPDGRYVITMINDPRPKASGPLRPQDRIYVANFMDYRFSQVFYPTKGILAYYDREARQMRPLPGADDSQYVQTGAFWSPDGKSIVFERALAKDPFPEGSKPPLFANDPNEVELKYDLYRIPFNDGNGGVPEAILGASRNGMSNNFPKVSPDGRWIVFVECRNGQLMRPDSKLYIVPFNGGRARRMVCNLSLMNSWHSFSPNGRWLAFSSKGRSPYTQLFLTHVDENGNDSPAILVENTTAANRAVNLPEFVNTTTTNFAKLDAPVTEFYRLFNEASDLEKKGQTANALVAWEKALQVDADDAKANFNFGLALSRNGRNDDAIARFEKAVAANPFFAEAHVNLGIARAQKGEIEEAIRHFQRAVEIEPDFANAHNNLGVALLQTGKIEEAIPHFQKAVDVVPSFADAQTNLGIALLQTGNAAAAQPHFEKALELNRTSVETYYHLGLALYMQGKYREALGRWREGLAVEPNSPALLGQLAWALATCPDASVRSGAQAVTLAERAVTASPTPDPALLDTEAAAYAEAGRFAEAVSTARQALNLATRLKAQPLIEGLKSRIVLYETGKPFRDTP